MKKFQVLRLLALSGITPFIALSAHAQDSYTYGGVGAGKSRSNLDAQSIAGKESGPGITVGNIARDNADNAYKVFLGYQFNRNWGVELGYFHLGQFTFDAATTPTGNLHGQTRLQGGGVDAVATLPLSESFSLLGRLGAQMTRARGAYTATGGATALIPNPSKRQVNPKVGVGLQYEFNRNFMVRGEVERYRISDPVGGNPNVNLYSVSLVVPFGRAPASSRVAIAPAPYVPPAPMPAAPPQPPVVVVAPMPKALPADVPPAPQPPRQRVSYSAESMFGFDRATLRPEGKAALDTFALELQGTRFESITVEGHTDRLGGDAYNQRLSEERAAIVKAYLVESGKIDPMKIVATGKGESTPVTKPADCVGKAATPQLVACLQPDRRVDIEVDGTRRN